MALSARYEAEFGRMIGKENMRTLRGLLELLCDRLEQNEKAVPGPGHAAGQTRS